MLDVIKNWFENRTIRQTEKENKSKCREIIDNFDITLRNNKAYILYDGAPIEKLDDAISDAIYKAVREKQSLALDYANIDKKLLG